MPLTPSAAIPQILVLRPCGLAGMPRRSPKSDREPRWGRGRAGTGALPGSWRSRLWSDVSGPTSLCLTRGVEVRRRVAGSGGTIRRAKRRSDRRVREVRGSGTRRAEARDPSSEKDCPGHLRRRCVWRYCAGVLSGWSETGTRPEFDVVTGISTGALIAVFAFLGPSVDAEMRAAYTAVSDGDIYRMYLFPRRSSPSHSPRMPRSSGSSTTTPPTTASAPSPRSTGRAGGSTSRRRTWTFAAQLSGTWAKLPRATHRKTAHSSAKSSWHPPRSRGSSRRSASRSPWTALPTSNGTSTAGRPLRCSSPLRGCRPRSAAP